MKLLEVFQKTARNMSNRKDLLLDEEFCSRTRDALIYVLGRAESVQFQGQISGDRRRTENQAQNYRQYVPVYTHNNPRNQHINLEDELMVALINKLCAMYEPMNAKTFMMNFWEAIGDFNHRMAMSLVMNDSTRKVAHGFL